MTDNSKAGTPGGLIDPLRLLSAVEHHVRCAHDGVASRERHVQMDSAIHAGAAVELMAKAVVALVDPALVWESEDSSQTLIDKYIQSGLIRPSAKTRKGRAPKSISAFHAVELAQRIVVELKDHGVGARHALEIRNTAAHAAQIEAELLEGRVLAATEYVVVGLESFGTSPSAVFGEERYNQILAQIAGHTTALRISAEKKVSTALQDYTSFTSYLSPTQRSRALRDRDHGPQHGDVSHRLKCPACENKGWTYWNVNVDLDYEGFGESSVGTTLVFVGFQCPFCHLELNDEEWDALDLSPYGDPADDFDIASDDLNK